jgi:predicted alpha/beta hydrolase family esterase
MPRKDDAKFTDWCLTFEKILVMPEVGKNIILIGHSLGACFLIHYLSHKTPKKKIQELHFVSGCIKEGDFRLEPDYQNIYLQTDQIHVWHSRDDQVVPFKEAQKISKNLPGAILHEFKDRGHFNQPYFPELVKELV